MDTKRFAILLSYFNILLYFIPITLLLLSDLSNNKGADKTLVIFYYNLLNIWYLFPGIIFIIGRKKALFRKYYLLISVLIVICFCFLFQQAIAYIGGM